MAQLVASIPDIAASDLWADVKRLGRLVIVVGDQEFCVTVAARPTKTGAFRLLVCPRCAAHRRDLYACAGEIGCRGCLRLRHPDQQLSGSRWSREVVRPTRQVARIDVRLATKKLDPHQRRKLRRRRAQLVSKIEAALARRRDKQVTALPNPPESATVS